jgi:hypothetical protein
MSELSTYIDQYRQAHERNDVEAKEQLLLDVPEAMQRSFHQAVQSIDPIEVPRIDADRARTVLLADGADADTADFLAAVTSGDLPALVTHLVPAGTETEIAQQLCAQLSIENPEATAELATYLLELAGRSEASILAVDPAAEVRATQLRRAWSLGERALDAMSDVLGMPVQVVARLRDATEYPLLAVGGLARGDGELFEAAGSGHPRSEVGRLFDDLQPPPN